MSWMAYARTSASNPQRACGPTPYHVHQIISNLLTNSAKYGQPPVILECAPVGDGVELRVRDQGPGVDPEFVPRMFERFSQASSGDTRTSAGFGLGLSITRDLAVANGGDLRYEPNLPTGACFIVRFPTVPARQSPTLPLAVGDPAAVRG